MRARLFALATLSALTLFTQALAGLAWAEPDDRAATALTSVVGHIPRRSPLIAGELQVAGDLMRPGGALELAATDGCQRQVSQGGSASQAAARTPSMRVSAAGAPAPAASGFQARQFALQTATADNMQMTLRGAWTDSDDDFTFVFQAEVSINNSLSGAFDWTLTNTPADSEYVSRIGATGKEFVEGKHSRVSRIVTFNGIRVSDPSLLGTDSYCVLLSSDLTTFTGSSRSNHGDWRGRLEGTAEVVSPN
jgi:hypothetical protein